MTSENWDIMIGRTIDNTYKIYDEVGSGGFSTVYLARNLRTNQVVALKVMLAQLAGNPRQRERFRREAQAAQAVDSLYIVKVLDHGQVDGRPYLVMEYVDGKTLAQVIQEQGPLPVEEAVRITRQLARALDAIHRAGIVHRDIKPGNIMITPSGPVKLMDLGIVKSAFMSTITQTGTYVGTPAYMSPEQIRGQQVDIRSDIYALGVVLYQMLTGRVPFDADSPWVVMRQHMDTPMPLAAVRRRDVPAWLLDVLKRMLAKEPAQRFQTPGELVRVLTLETDGKDVPPPAPIPGTAAGGGGRRLPSWAPFAIIGVFLLFGLGAVVLANGLRPSPVPAPTPTSTAAPTSSATLTMTPTSRPAPTSTPTSTRTPTNTATPSLTPTITPTPTPSRTPTPSADAVVDTEALNVRNGPATAYMVVGKLKAGDGLTVTGKNEDASWLKIETKDIEEGWVIANLVQMYIDLGGVPVAEVPLTPTPAGPPRITTANADRVVLLHTLTGHAAPVRSVAFSPDGGTLASGAHDRTVRLWQITDGSLLRTLAEHKGEVRTVAFSPDGTILASGSWLEVRLWRVTNGTLMRVLDQPGIVSSVAFSPDGRTLAVGFASGFTKEVRLLRVSDGAHLQTLAGHRNAVLSVAFSPDGQTLAWGSGYPDDTVRLSRVADGSLMRTLTRHGGAVWGVAFSPDGQILASGSDDYTVQLWQASGGAQLHTLKGHTHAVLSVAFSPDGAILASGSADKTVRLWRVSDGALLHTLEGHTGDVDSVSFAPDGRTLASGSKDGIVRLWTVRRAEY